MARTRRSSMLGLALSVALLGSVGVVASGCSVDATGSEAQHDTEATVFTPLGVSTADEVADAVEEILNEQLDKCIEWAPGVDLVTPDNIRDFTHKGYMSYNGLAEAIEGILQTQGLTEIAPDDLRQYFRGWALPLVETGEDGVAIWNTAPLVIYYGILRSNRNNAFDRAVDPEGVDIEQLAEQWDLVTDGSMLDHDFILPVKVSKNPSLAEIRQQVHGRWVDEWSWGYDAIDDFWQSQEGPEGHPAFEPIADMLGSAGITKRYYLFAGGYDYGPWTRNYLVVIDEHDQMYGFMMGYSE